MYRILKDPNSVRHLKELGYQTTARSISKASLLSELGQNTVPKCGELIEEPIA